MPLNIHDRAVLSDLFEESDSLSLSLFKKICFECFLLLWNQKPYSVRLQIATYYANLIISISVSLISEKSPGQNLRLRDFFTDSLLAAKLNTNYFQRLFISAKVNKDTCSILLDRIFSTNKDFNKIFKKSIQEKANAQKVFAENIHTLKTWLKAQTLFLTEEGKKYNDQIVNYTHTTIDQSFSFFLILYLCLTLQEQESALTNSAIFMSILMTIDLLYFHLKHSFRQFNVVCSGLQLDLEDIKISNETTEIKTPSANASAKPALTPYVADTKPNASDEDSKLEINNAKPVLILTTENLTTPIYSKSYEEFKIAREKKLKRKPPSEPVNDAKQEQTENILPAFFGPAFTDVQPAYMVAIDENNLGRNHNYFAIWDAVSILSFFNTKKRDEMKIYHTLFSIFKEGKVANKNNTSGIKLIPNLGLFTIKKPRIPARVYGDEIVKTGNKEAIIFRYYAKNGFHH